MEDKQIKFEMYQKLGSELLDRGKWFLANATKINRTIFSAVGMHGAVKDNVGISPILYDEKYHTTNIETWKTIIENDWTNKKEWITDIFDCDNFSGSFCAYCAEIYNLNTAGRFTVELLNPETNAHIGYHRAVIIIDDKKDCYLLESQTDEMVKIESGVMPVIGKWKYKVNFVEFN